MSKHRYHSVELQAVDWARVQAAFGGERVVVGVDVAKHDFVAALLDGEGEVVVTIRWQHPQQSRALVARLRELAAVVEVVLEPSGTYADALIGQLRAAGLGVYRVAPKRVHDAAEVYDGVPSLHDVKAAHLIGRLHREGVSTPWEAPDATRRALQAQLSQLGVYKARQQRGRSRLEAQLSRHWPESLVCFELDSVSLLRLIAAYGAPAQVAADRPGAAALLRRSGGANLDEAKIQCLLTGAADTVGLACVPAERAWLQALAQDLLATRAQVRDLERALQAAVGCDEALSRVAAVIGAVSAAVLWASQGDPRAYPNAASLLKSCGLNLKERSSGTHRGQLRITKRGPGVVRFYLYFAALRLLAQEACVQRWYVARMARPGAVTGKNVVALMRKLTRALWHVARGARFDATRLFELGAREA